MNKKNTTKKNLELFAERYVDAFWQVENRMNLQKQDIYDGAFDEVQRNNYIILEELFQARAYEQILLAMTAEEDFPDIDAILEKYYYKVKMDTIKKIEKYSKEGASDVKQRLEDDKVNVKKYKDAYLFYLCRGDFVPGEQNK